MPRNDDQAAADQGLGLVVPLRALRLFLGDRRPGATRAMPRLQGAELEQAGADLQAEGDGMRLSGQLMLSGALRIPRFEPQPIK